MRRSGKLFRAVATVALVAAVAACSSSSKQPSTSSSNPASSGTSGGTRAPSGAPIKVGIICTCSGPFGGANVPDVDVYKAWVNTVNGSGGIKGHPVQVTTEDDAGNPGTALTDARTLISDHMDAIVDASTTTQAWAAAVQAANVPVVGMNDNEAPMFTNPDFYPEGQTADSQGTAYIMTLKTAGASSFGDMYCVESVSCAQFEQLLKTAGGKVGVPLTYSTTIAATAPNFTAQCLAAQQKQIKYLVLEDGATIIARVATDCDRQGYDPTYVIGGGSYSPLFETTPGVKADTWSYYPNLPYWAKTPAVEAMNAAVDKYYPGLRQNANLWDELASQSWPSGLLLADAVKAGGLNPGDTPSAAEIIKGLESLKGDTLDGWAPPLTFPAGKAHPVGCWFTGRLQNGVSHLIDNGHLTCGSGSSS